MSEAQAETPTRAPAPSAGASGNVFQRKFGPLPGWGWAALAALAAGGYLWWRNHQANAASSSAATPDQTAADTGVNDDVAGQLSTIQTEIQGLQGEESSEGSTPNSTTPPAKGKREVSGGAKTLNQLAKERGMSVAQIVSLSEASGENATNLAKLKAWAAHPGTKRKGVVYYA